MAIRDSIRTAKLKPTTPKTSATDQASALRESGVEHHVASPRRRSRSLPSRGADEYYIGHRHCSGDLGYLLLQINFICVLLFLIGATAIAKYPDWLGGTPIAVQSLE